LLIEDEGAIYKACGIDLLTSHLRDVCQFSRLLMPESARSGDVKPQGRVSCLLSEVLGKAIARSGLKAIAFKNGQASKLPIHSRELARCDRPSGLGKAIAPQKPYIEATLISFLIPT